MNLPKLKHRETYNLLVIRITNKGTLTSAKPCYHCIKQLMRAQNIKIKNIYYSDPPGVIQKISFEQIINDVLNNKYNYISSGYRLRMNLNRKLEKNYNKS